MATPIRGLRYAFEEGVLKMDARILKTTENDRKCFCIRSVK